MNFILNLVLSYISSARLTSQCLVDYPSIILICFTFSLHFTCVNRAVIQYTADFEAQLLGDLQYINTERLSPGAHIGKIFQEEFPKSISEVIDWL